MKKERGLSLGGLIVVLFLLIMVALLGFKVFTPYVQYFTIKKTFKTMAADPDLKSGGRREILSAWSRYADIDNITTISPDDIEIAKDANGVIISANYSVKVPLVANVSLLLDFNPTSSSP